MKLQEENPIDYNECTREQLIEIVLRRDENFIKLADDYLKTKDHINNLCMFIADEMMGMAKNMQTEMILTQAGTPSIDAEDVQKDMGKVEAYTTILNKLTPIFK